MTGKSKSDATSDNVVPMFKDEDEGPQALICENCGNMQFMITDNLEVAYCVICDTIYEIPED